MEGCATAARGSGWASPAEGTGAGIQAGSSWAAGDRRTGSAGGGTLAEDCAAEGKPEEAASLRRGSFRSAGNEAQGETSGDRSSAEDCTLAAAATTRTFPEGEAAAAAEVEGVEEVECLV